MGPHDALPQWQSAVPQGFPSRCQLDATHQVQCGIDVVAVVSELAFDLEM